MVLFVQGEADPKAYVIVALNGHELEAPGRTAVPDVVVKATAAKHTEDSLFVLIIAPLRHVPVHIA